MAHAACRPADLSSLLFLLACWVLHAPQALGATEEELFFKGTDDVNEGPLKFVDPPADRPLHHHQNRITIDDASLDSGWVRLDQCHEHLDAVPSSQIVYNQDRIRSLRVESLRNIGEARVEGHTVQLREVGTDARLCIQAETRALNQNGDSGWQLNNGPYMRRFLDGYYPLRVSLDVRLATPRLRYVAMEPPPQPGFHVWQQTDAVGYDTVFEGMLRTVIHFDAVVGR